MAIHSTEDLWPVLEQLGDRQSSFLLERFIPGYVFHVDSVVSENEVVFASVSKYGKPRMNVAQGGGIFTTCVIPRGSAADTGLRQINRDLIAALGLVRGVAHTEFIQAHADGHLYFLECAARVGPHRSRRRKRDLPASSSARGLCRSHSFPRAAGESRYFGVQRSGNMLAHQEASPRRLVLRSSDPHRVQLLLDGYSRRFAAEFLAVEPPRDKPAS